MSELLDAALAVQATARRLRQSIQRATDPALQAQLRKARERLASKPSEVRAEWVVAALEATVHETQGGTGNG